MSSPFSNKGLSSSGFVGGPLDPPALEKMAADEVNVQLTSQLIARTRESLVQYMAAQTMVTLDLGELLGLLKSRGGLTELTLDEHHFTREISVYGQKLSDARTLAQNLAGSIAARLDELAVLQAKGRVDMLKPGDF